MLEMHLTIARHLAL